MRSRALAVPRWGRRPAAATRARTLWARALRPWAPIAWLLAVLASPAAAEPFVLGLPPVARAGDPVVVRAAFDLRDINAIDDEREAFEFSGVLTLTWHDERAAFDPAVEGTDEKIYQGDYQFDEVATGWYPQVVLVNSAGFLDEQGTLLRILPDGTHVLVEAVVGEAKTDLDLRRFPFDAHRLEAVFEVLGFDEREVVLEVALKGGSANREASARVPQWELVEVSATTRTERVPHAGDLGVSRTFVVAMDVERRSLFMVRLVLFPLGLLVMLSWSIFWMDQSSVGDRLNVSFIGILTAVAYQNVVSESLPRIAYLTFMNSFVNFSFMLLCVSALVNLRVGYLDRFGNSAAGDRIDRRSRWIFPLVYFGVLSTVGVYFAVAA